MPEERDTEEGSAGGGGSPVAVPVGSLALDDDQASRTLVEQTGRSFEKLSRTAAARHIIDQMKGVRRAPSLSTFSLIGLFGTAMFTTAWWLLPSVLPVLAVIAVPTLSALFFFGLEVIAHRSELADTRTRMISETGWHEDGVAAAMRAARDGRGAPAVQEALALGRCPRPEQLPAPDRKAERRRAKRANKKAPALQPWRR